MKNSKSDVLISYDAVVKSQGGGGRVWPNPLKEHVGKRAKVIIYDEDSTEDPERLPMQIQNQLRCIRG
ncbi:DUF2080 family transposase-associated protein [Methanococcus maripaludis]|uniref:DUF2080 family transposase-associated protein n=1 Tax=Methanococcus maripaludis TaxID=39152 RepID=UPI0015EC8E42|nr:DUF2080 family transposase-associated protein [Methanococcus maripaludis]